MSRIRTVKPELFRHSDLYDAEKESGLPIRLAFIGLFTACDRRGRFKWRPRDLKVEILPHDDCDFSRVLDACLTRGFIIKYQVDEQWYGCIPTFELHQVINNRESESVLPPPPEKDQKQVQKVTRGARVDDASGTREAREGHADTGEGKGKERKEKPLYPLSEQGEWVKNQILLVPNFQINPPSCEGIEDLVRDFLPQLNGRFELEVKSAIAWALAPDHRYAKKPKKPGAGVGFLRNWLTGKVPDKAPEQEYRTL